MERTSSCYRLLYLWADPAVAKAVREESHNRLLVDGVVGDYARGYSYPYVAPIGIKMRPKVRGLYKIQERNIPHVYPGYIVRIPTYAFKIRTTCGGWRCHVDFHVHVERAPLSGTTNIWESSSNDLNFTPNDSSEKDTRSNNTGSREPPAPQRKSQEL